MKANGFEASTAYCKANPNCIRGTAAVWIKPDCPSLVPFPTISQKGKAQN